MKNLQDVTVACVGLLLMAGVLYGVVHRDTEPSSAPLLQDATKFISLTGDDLTGDGSSVKPYRTLRFALKKHGVSYDYMQKVNGHYVLVPTDAMCVFREAR